MAALLTPVIPPLMQSSRGIRSLYKAKQTKTYIKKLLKDGFTMTRGKIHKKGEATFLEILNQFKEKIGKEVGGIGSFTGIVRGIGEKDGEVKKLSYEYAETAEQELEKIAKEVEEQTEGVSRVEVHHVIGDLEPSEEIMYVLVAGSHREEVFEALPKIVDRIKSEARIWKKEITEDDSYWMHEAKGD